MSDEERCAAARQFELIDRAFRKGDLDGLRSAVKDPSIVPNGRMPDTIGPCLTYAIYHSPLPFIRTLLEIGANPNASADDGFPPLIAALTTGREVAGATKRTDVDDVIRLLLSFGADPNQRGINDYTPLHMAVAERNALAVQLLLDAGADRELRTRIDDCQSPLEMAQAAGLDAIAVLLAPTGPPRKRLRSGLTLLADMPGTGEVVRRQHNYTIRLRMWLHRGEAVRWSDAWAAGGAKVDDNGETLTYEARIHRASIISGLFYGVEGMRVGGTRRLEIAPHLAFGEPGVPGVIPPNAVLIAEITILDGF